jgi:hypothetical protein
MARTCKEGLDYFPLDVDIHQDEKVYIIEAKYGLVGFALLIRILMRIYKNGYYLPWDETTAFVFAKQNGADVKLLKEVVNDCIEYGLFNRMLFLQYGILTSAGIQKRYLEATSRRKQITLIEEYLLIDVPESDRVKMVTRSRHSCRHHVDNNRINVDINPINDDINPINDDINRINVDINPQSKVKESKVKESKVIITSSKEEVRCTEFVQRVVEAWNSHGINPIKTITPQTNRYKLLMARKKEHGEQAIFEAIENVSKSTFLKGGGSKGWTITFDWFVKPNNFIKVYEGAYSDDKWLPGTTEIVGGPGNQGRSKDIRKLPHDEYMKEVMEYARKRFPGIQQDGERDSRDAGPAEVITPWPGDVF